MRLTKTFLLFFLLINIVCVTFAPKPSEASSSRSTWEANLLKNVLYNQGSSDTAKYYPIDVCKDELNTVFKSDSGWDNFMYAFVDTNEADFEERSKATIKYHEDLLNTAQQICRPNLENPQDYCNNRYDGQGYVACLRGIAKLGCVDKFDADSCVKKLYFSWKLEDSPRLIPLTGTENMSYKFLKNVISIGTNRYPHANDEELMMLLSDRNLLKEFYANHEDRRPTSDVAVEEQDLLDARFESYGVKEISYGNLFIEYNRRSNFDKLYGGYYSNYLYKQIKDFGELELDPEGKNEFEDPETFCCRYLSDNPDYYNNQD